MEPVKLRGDTWWNKIWFLFNATYYDENTMERYGQGWSSKMTLVFFKSMGTRNYKNNDQYFLGL